MYYALVKNGTVLETYRYADEVEMRERNHPDFYPNMHPCPQEVRRGWGYDDVTGAYTEPELYSMVESLNEPYLPTEAQRIALLEAQTKLLEAQNKALADRGEFLEDCIAEMAGLLYV